MSKSLTLPKGVHDGFLLVVKRKKKKIRIRLGEKKEKKYLIVNKIQITAGL